MLNQNYIKNILIRIFLLFNLLKINLQQELESNKNTLILLKARKEGYDLSDSTDDFFLDICEDYSYNKKDITLDYRQHYFFFPKDNNIKIEFLHPKRNNTNLCFWVFFEFKNFFTNVSFYFLFPLFLIQISILSSIFFMSLDKLFYHTPFKKKELQKSFKNNCIFCKKYNNNKKKNIKNFTKFIPEANIEQNSTTNKYNETEKHLIVPSNINNINNTKKDDLISYSNKSSSDSQQAFNNKTINYSISNTTDVVKQNIEESRATAEFDDYSNKDEKEIEKVKEKNIEENNINKININDNKEDSMSYHEKSIDNYSFGLNTKLRYNFYNNEKISSKRNENNDFKIEDKIKKTEIIYNTINKDINKDDINKDINKNINKDLLKSNTSLLPPFQYGNNIIKKNPENIEYIREEYFYFGYLLARIKDKRSVIDIYLDFLEQCQIIFKFFFIPFNIYEDIKLQIIYYGIKLQLYFLFNCLLLKEYVINDIYDNKNYLIYDIYRSFLSCIYTYLIGLFLYYLTNIKKTLIKRRYKLENMRISEQRLILEIYKVTYNICMDYLFHKLIIFSISLIFIFLSSFYICYSFCAVYKYTQIYILKGAIFSAIIALISPFIFCWIPSFLRHISLSLKNEKLYRFVKLIELLFIP